MNSTVVQFLDALGPGALWVNAAGHVRHANRVARGTGLTLGGAIVDPDLARAVKATALDTAPRTVDALGLYSPGSAQFVQFRCQVLRAAHGDGAIVFIEGEGHGGPVVRDSEDCRQVPLPGPCVDLRAHQNAFEQRHNRRVTGQRRMSQAQHRPAE